MNLVAIHRTIELTHELEARQETLLMGSWGRDDHQCGTYGCIAGWMTLDPELRALGLENVSSDNLEPMYSGTFGHRAIARFLEVPKEVVENAFGSWHENSWAKARERLEKLLDFQ